MKRLVFIAFALVAVGKINAQQIPAYHHYFLNPMVFNPAATGNSSTINAYIMRSQRNMSFEGGNIVNALTVDGGLFENKLGLGVSLYSDVMGASSSAGALLSASYRVRFSEESYLRFGITGGAEDYKINFNQAVVKDIDDAQLNFYYPSRKIVPNVSAGLMFQWKDLQLHVSVPQLLGMSSELKSMTNDGTSTGGSHTFERHFVGMARYDFKFEKIGLKISPFAMTKFIPGAKIIYDGGFVADFRDFVWLNATYKSDYTVTPAVGFKIKKSFVIGYAYDVILNSTKSQAGINQEILAGFQFPVKSADNKKKELEAAQKEIERLNGVVVTKQNQNDSIQRSNAVKVQELNDEMAKKSAIANDSINELNQLLAAKNEVVKNETPIKNETPVKNNERNFDDSQIKKSKDDYFTEVDKSDSPIGLYLVFGAFGSEENATSQLTKYKAQFPDARMIFNARNGFKYIILTYSTDKAPVFDAKVKANQMGLTKAWILNYVR